MKEIV